MSQVKRLYVEKKPSYAVKAKELAEELKAYLSIDDVSNVRVLIRYDVENVSAETMEKAAVTVFSVILSLCHFVNIHLMVLGVTKQLVIML